MINDYLNLILDTNQFGIVLTVLVYTICKALYDKTKWVILYPLTTSSLLIILMLLLFGIEYEVYNKGASLISYILGPATVALAIPLYKKREYLKKYFVPIWAGAFAGSAFSIVIIFYMSQWFKLSEEIAISILPKSVTAPIAIGISDETGGIVAITIFAVILTGMLGSIFGPYVMKIFRISDKVAQGIGIGTAAHGGGTAKAIEMGEIQGAMSGLAMGLAGIATSILLPIFLAVM